MTSETLVCTCLIIGGGLSAHVAAEEIAKSGGTVVLIADGAGASPYVHGIQIPTLASDSAQLFLRDTYEGGCRQGNYALEQLLCEGSLGVREQLEELGLHPNRTPDGQVELLQPLGASCPRVVSVGNALGAFALAALKSRLAGRVRMLSGRAVRLFCEDGAFAALCYVEGKLLLIGAQTVLLAAGGFGNLYAFTTNSADMGGDALAMAYGAGAQLIDLEFVQFEPSVAVWPQAVRGKSVITTLFYDGAVLYNGRGERFMGEQEGAERVGKDVLAAAMFREIAAGRGTEHGGVYLDCTRVDAQKMRTVYHAYYERYLACGIDLLEQPVEIAAGAHTTLGGVRIDGDCRTCVPGLYACGEAAGGIHGANRLGGNAGLETFVFGRRAGRSIFRALTQGERRDADCRGACAQAAAFLRETPFAAFDPAPVRARMRETMSRELGVVRCGAGIVRAREEFARLRAQLPRSCAEEVLRLENDLTAAELVARCCAERTQSIGCHIRSDCPDAGESQRYTVVAADGTIYREAL